MWFIWRWHNFTKNIHQFDANSRSFQFVSRFFAYYDTKGFFIREYTPSSVLKILNNFTPVDGKIVYMESHIIWSYQVLSKMCNIIQIIRYTPINQYGIDRDILSTSSLIPQNIQQIINKMWLPKLNAKLTIIFYFI